MNNDVLELSRPSSCKNDEYFDTKYFSCRKCNIFKFLEPSTDHLRCVCNKFSKTIGFKNGNPICTKCDQNQTVTIDGKDCIVCKNNTCKCLSNEILIERNWNGTLLNSIKCLPCPKDTYPSKENSKCLPCNNLDNRNQANCICPMKSHVRIHGYCLNKDNLSDWPDVKSTYTIKFQNENVDSYYLRTELQAAMYFCKNKNKMSCEHLSHICVLSLYVNSVQCTLFMQTHMAPVKLFYNKDETSLVLNAKNITQIYSLKKNDDNNTLNFTMATFSLEGKLLEIDSPNMPCHFLTNVRFGVNLNKKCIITVKDLLNMEVKFIQLYLTFKEEEKVLSHAVPIYIKKEYENDYDISETQLVRKFFLVDNISGIKALPNFLTGTFLKKSNLSVLRYMKSFTILINIQSGKARGKIYPPIVIIEYGELMEQQISKNVEVTINYKVTFALKENHINSNIQIFIGILSSIAIINSALKTWTYCKKNYDCTPNATISLWFLIYVMGAIGNSLIIALISVCIYLFIFFKGQTIPYTLLPNISDEKNIQIFTIIGFCLKIVEIMGFIYQHWDIHIFFIDWEQPKLTHNSSKYDSPYTSFRKLYTNILIDGKDENPKTPSEIIAAKRNKTFNRTNKKNAHSQIFKPIEQEELQVTYSISKSSIQEENNTQLSVSIWRTYLVANEWLKLLTKRKINISLQIISTLLVLEVIGVKYWSLAIPEITFNKYTDVRINFSLQYAVCAIVYITIYFIQYLTSIIFYERFIKDQMQQFIDLCSIANISVFILEYNYYGFYIHGRSVHGFSDTDLFTLINNLKNEENQLCAHRGLVPGTIEQNFIISVTQTFRTFYEKFYTEKNFVNSSQSSIPITNRFLKKNIYTSMDWNQICNTRVKLNQFLCEFLDHCFKNEDYIIKEQNLIEKLCDILYTNTNKTSVFYIDNDYSFSQVILYGNEWLMGTFEITIFLFVLTLYDNYVLAAAITFILSQLFIVIIKYSGRKNLSSKTLLDERFLM
ncbi:meckelin-like isoform X1 [Vespa mandarinia]|uniref:meckelin-like isoform X1 n=1 Tax=Vespa mandarinia TaxID=7446 RepID=UPI001618235F|nr:meckelin-like isoform X1 [Vespa mandarinia]XP_035737912.1 meckelin-like isoform X1 [Vespa mandarinia]XP_035737922.1 meckelin-like isoform X1 [Vespa mandarinia]XP_035737932.1 meckelin-like isoform X1 [Vespa mandarinia]